MRKIISILFLTVLVGCGQMQSTDSNQPEPKETQETATEKQTVEQPEMETKDVSTIKEPKEETFYSNAFDEPVKGLVPATIKIESIGVEAPVERVGLQKDGKMDVPKDYRNAGWYKSGAKPGEQGSAVLAGHVNDPKGKGIFWDLNKLEVGDEVKISDESGETLVFKVVDKKAYDLGEAPVEQIFGYTPRRMLNLITCTGDYIQDIGTHNQRLVVYTELVDKK
ncbi:class F sortase [Virgibacillus necropolis]|uniref:Sortase n=1 Tax=Virgibacillus necropolis TaxID=163877 RepID=A0A221MHL0_9BACI|nr:class F sortase [Virgibacillus necropolis]ASN07121.1 sortase [Virgibacillus necropolis]